MIPRPIALCTLLVTLLTGCGTSPPVHFHALGAPGAPLASGRARMLVEVMPVAIPERLNREEMVLGAGTGGLELMDYDRWAAPLDDEVRQVLDQVLWRRLGAADSYRVPVADALAGMAQFRLALRIERFEAVPGHQAIVEASWTVRKLPAGRPAVCRAGVEVALPAATPAAAAGALAEGTARLMESVASSIDRLEQGAADSCPERAPVEGG